MKKMAKHYNIRRRY